MNKIKKYCEQLTSFPLALTLNRFKVKMNPTVKNLEEKDKLIKAELSRSLSSVLGNISNYREQIHNNKTVWVMWQQGFVQAPSLVKLCRKSLDVFLPKDVKIIELDDSNIGDYVSIPDNIYKKYCEGIISRAHYSDIVRCLILKEYGGLWIDSTVLLTAPLDSNVFEDSFWSIKQSKPIVSNFNWSMYMLGGVNNLIYSVLGDLLIQYWNIYDVEIDYLFLDYLMDLMRENDDRIKQMIADVPCGNDEVLTLCDVVRQGESLETIKSLLNSSTKIFKMTYRLPENTEAYQLFVSEVEHIMENKDEEDTMGKQ